MADIGIGASPMTFDVYLTDNNQNSTTNLRIYNAGDTNQTYWIDLDEDIRDFIYYNCSDDTFSNETYWCEGKTYNITAGDNLQVKLMFYIRTDYIGDITSYVYPKVQTGGSINIVLRVDVRVGIHQNSPPKYNNITTNFTTPVEYQQNLALQFNSTWTAPKVWEFSHPPPVDTVLFSSNYTSEWENTSVVNHSGSEYYHNIQNLPVGTFGHIWYANDTENNWNSTDLQTFTIQDTTPPIVKIQSPLNQTYATNLVWANVTLHEAGSWCGRNLDGNTNVTMTNSSGNWNNQMTGLSEGSHNVRVYCNDTAGNMNGSSANIVYFTVDTTPPTISNVTITPNTTTNGTLITINATITDALGVNSSTVKAYIQKPDETILSNITLSNVSSLYNGTWNTTGFSTGTYFVDINATDISGNQRKENNIATIVLSAESGAIGGNIINNTVSTVNNQTTVTVTTSSNTNVTLEITTNQTISNASVSVTEYSKNPAGSGFTLTALGKYIEIDVSPELENALKWTIIKIYYTDTEVSTAGLDESSLIIEYYNATYGNWTTYSTPFGIAPSCEVNTTANFIRANTTHFSVLGLFGSSPTTTTISSSGGGSGNGGSSMIIPTNTTITSSTTIPLTTVTPKGLEITTTTMFATPTKRQENLGITDIFSVNTRNALLLMMIMIIIFVIISVWKSP